MLVALGNSRRAKQSLSAQFQPAIATHHTAVGTGRLPSTTTTHRANFSGDSHHSHFTLHSELISRKWPGQKLCVHLVQERTRLWRTEEKQKAFTTEAGRQGEDQTSCPRIHADGHINDDRQTLGGCGSAEVGKDGKACPGCERILRLIPRESVKSAREKLVFPVALWREYVAFRQHQPIQVRGLPKSASGADFHS